MNWFEYTHVSPRSGIRRMKARLLAVKGESEGLPVMEVLELIEENVKAGHVPRSELDDALAKVAEFERRHPGAAIGLDLCTERRWAGVG